MKSEIGKRLEKLRKQRGLSRLQLAKELIKEGIMGYDSVESLNQYLYMIEKGRRKPKDETLKPIADYFGVPIQWLKGEIIYIPIVGSAKAGCFGGHLAELAEEFFPLPASIVTIPEPEERTFFLEVKGDSMLPEFRPGDLVHLADPSYLPPANGDVVVVIKDREATLKKYKLENDKVILIPLNEKYDPIELPAEQEGKEFWVFKVIGSYKRYR